MEIFDLNKFFENIEEKIKDYPITFIDTGLISPYLKGKDKNFHSLKIIIKEMMEGNLNGNKSYLKEYIERLSSLVNKYNICTIPEVIKECEDAVEIARDKTREIKRRRKSFNYYGINHLNKIDSQYRTTEINLREYANKLEWMLENIKIEDKNPVLFERRIYLPLVSVALESRKYCENESNDLRTDELLVARAHYLSMNRHKGILILTADRDLKTLSKNVYEKTKNSLKRSINKVSVYDVVREAKPEAFLSI